MQRKDLEQEGVVDQVLRESAEAIAAHEEVHGLGIPGLCAIWREGGREGPDRCWRWPPFG